MFLQNLTKNTGKTRASVPKARLAKKEAAAANGCIECAFCERRAAADEAKLYF